MTVEEYEAAFHGINLPTGPIELSPGVLVKDIPLFLEKELTILRAGNNACVQEPVRWRLDRLIQILNEAQ